MAKRKEENPLFVGITNGEDIRRGVLECSKGILESLESYERFKSLKEEKIKLIYQFKYEIGEISKLTNRIKKYLPSVKKAEIKKPEAKKVREEKTKFVKIEKPKGKTDIERLEAELNEIEEKLDSLS